MFYNDKIRSTRSSREGNDEERRKDETSEEKAALFSSIEEVDPIVTERVHPAELKERSWRPPNNNNNNNNNNNKICAVLVAPLVAFGLGMVVALIGQTVFSASTPDIAAMATTSDDHENLVDVAIHRLRLEVAHIALDFMVGDTVEAASKSPQADIGRLVDVVQSRVDIVGFRGMIQAFGDAGMVVAFNDAAKQRHLSTTFEVALRVRKSDTVGPAFSGIPNDRTIPLDDFCTGCIWWLQHWLGAILADKFVRDGSSMRLDNDDNRRLDNVSAVYQEIHRMQKVHFPEHTHQNIGHGFGWQYMVATRPDMKTFPLDLVETFCGDYDTDEYVNDLKSYIDRSCQHTIGHGVFYVLASRESGGTLDVRHQFRYAGGFQLTEDYFCEAIRICAEAPEDTLESQCLSGVKHSSILLNDGQKQNFHGSTHQLKSRCGIEDNPH